MDPKNHANTLHDQQHLILKQLAEKINITSFTTDAGQVTRPLRGWPAPVEGIQSFNLATRVDPDAPQRLLVDLNDAQGNWTDVTAQIRSGHIYGLLAQGAIPCCRACTLSRSPGGTTDHEPESDA